MPDEERLQTVDLNDMSLGTEELTGYDPSADAHAMPPPPADGVHRVKLSRPADRAWKQRRDDDGKLVNVGTTVRADSVEETNFVLFDHRMGTRVARNGGCAVNDAMRAITGKPAKARDHLGLARELETLLAGFPIVKVETQWEASCPDCKDVSKGTGAEFNHRIKRGMRNFPLAKQSVDGKGEVRRHEIECDRCHQIVAAQGTILRYLPDQAGAPLTPTQASPVADPQPVVTPF